MLDEGLKVLLAPLLIWQGRRVRRLALRLPEAAGAREGEAGRGEPCLRLLIVGDSSAAGVGAATQDEALAGRLAQALAVRLQGRVRWRLLARSGDLCADALRQLHETELEPADVMVTALGVNDTVGQVPVRRWLAQLQALHQLAVARAGVRYTLHSAVPPMHAFALLPQPLRVWLGLRALRLNRALSRQLAGHTARGLQSLPAPLHQVAAARRLMAPDGFHPNPEGYALWAEVLAERIVQEWPRIAAEPLALRSHCVPDRAGPGSGAAGSGD